MTDPLPPLAQAPADLLIEAADEANPAPWQETMAEIADLCADELRASLAGIPQEEARRLGASLAVRLSAELGGSSYYWPKGDALSRAAIHLTIWSEYDGTKDGPGCARALARRYRMAENSIRRILARQRELHQRNR